MSAWGETIFNKMWPVMLYGLNFAFNYADSVVYIKWQC